MSKTRVKIAPEHRAILEKWIRTRTAPQRLVLRSRIVLLAAEGLSDLAVGKRLRVTRQTVRLWRRRFETGGPPTLVRDAPGRGRKRLISAESVTALLKVKPGAKRPTIRELARRLGVSPSSVHRLVIQQKR
jgi:Homeodomain-like domain/IclR helix-turn-helix domain